MLGITSGGRTAPRRVGRFEIGLLHRNLSLLTLVFLGVHVVTAVLDPFVHLSRAVSVVPYGASYRPLWLGLGTAAFDLLIAVLVTSAVRHRLGVRRWKAVHWLAYAAWPIALFHSAGTGTDTRLPLQLWLCAACLAAVVAAVWWRLAKSGPGMSPGV
ncbi:ferric reductase-like transmembrane domain-containing protein [Streptomyces sp. NPDC058877]|uniref:ferric reductase-like transmembrane domain-containing protein n=1 Tax=unclassified Streptomyces TaxID=2593676 RepID=UPI0036BCD19E